MESLTRLWPDPVSGPYTLRLWFDYPHGCPAVVGFEMWGVAPVTDADPISRKGLPDIGVTAAASRLRLGELLDAWTALFGPPAPTALQVKPMREQSGGRGRPRMPDEFLREVANVYRQSARRGNRAPSRFVWEWAKANGHPDATESAARGWIRRARLRGFLPQGTPGKVSIEKSA